MRKLFERSSIGSMSLSNRFVRSATWEGMADEHGDVTQKLIETMTALARGGVGLIIGGHTAVSQDGLATPWQLRIDHDHHIHRLREMTDAVHQNGSKIIMQLSHAGNFTDEKLTGSLPLVVSDFEGLSGKPRKEMGIQDIQELIKSFANAARRARSAGFDGVELHSAHGYLLSQFMSPYFNRREDEYGGTIANRIRIHSEILQAIRNETGINYPVLIKMNGQDFTESGLGLEESLQAATLISDVGFDAIELSGGLLTNREFSPTRAGVLPEENEVYYREEARLFKKSIHCPLILVGGIRSFEIAKQLVESGTTDYIAMSRPFIREPDLVNRWKTINHDKSECISDNRCFRPGFRGTGIYCVSKDSRSKNQD